MFSRTRALLFAVLIAIIGLVINNHPSYAFFFEPRSITLSNGTPGAVASHNFILQPVTAGNIGSLVFEYCTNSPLATAPCTPPAGLDTSGAVLSFQSGNTGFSIDAANTTSNKIVLTRTVASGLLVLSKYDFDEIINPTTPAQTVYARLYSYPSADGTGSFIDRGAATFAVQTPFEVDTYVPPFLRLCVGVTVAPDCSSMGGDNIDLGILSSQHANVGQSQFATATNDPSGYVVYAMGETMTSGNNIIDSVGSPSSSIPGTRQFGINLRANLNPVVGQDPVGLGTASPTANYNLPNHFMYVDGDSIVRSDLNTDYNRMTVSYLVNIDSKQPPGVYATTITYVATVQF